MRANDCVMMNDKPLYILVLEDRLEDFDLIKFALRKSGLTFESLCVDSKDEYTAALHSFKPDVILSDHALPQFNSIEALKICRGVGLNTPFILVTGTVSEEFAVTALKQGADDYILKSNLSRLPNAIVNSLRQRDLEKMRSLAEQDLRRQNEELTKVNRELDNFVYSVSHDIRSPLMSVLGLVNIIQKDDDNLVNREQLFDMMRSSIHRLDGTLLEIIDYSKNARSEISVSEINIKSMLDECYDHLKYMAGANDMIKEVAVQNDVKFYSDAYRLNIIFNNLISNSIKYRDQKKNPFIKVNVAVDEEFAMITFQDNGIGINAQSLQKIFDMFYRATDHCEGSGLGLYIVKEAVEKLGGKINVESVERQSTRFIIQIPNFQTIQQHSKPTIETL
jgi:signal transduction histidine kinase